MATAPWSDVALRLQTYITARGDVASFADPWGGSAAFTAPAIQVPDDPEQLARAATATGRTFKNPITLWVWADGAARKPQANEQVTFPSVGGTTYTIQTREAVSPAGEDILWAIIGGI